MDNIINLIKTILPQILPVVSLLLGIWIKSLLDKNTDNKNYLRKYKENEINELKDYFNLFSKNFKNILDDCSLYNTVIENSLLHNAFMTKFKNFDDLEYIILMKTLYFNENSLDDFFKTTFELTGLWIDNSPITNMDGYRSACSDMIIMGKKYQKDIIQLIKKKQNELLSLK
jgi:hypothetical protein